MSWACSFGFNHHLWDSTNRYSFVSRYWKWSDMFFFSYRPPTRGLYEWWLSLGLIVLQWVFSHYIGCAVVISVLAKDAAHMASGKVSYPSVFVVDSHMRPPPLPPKPASRHRLEAVQTLLFILVTLALFGMAVEACFIYHLYSVKEAIVSTIRCNFYFRLASALSVHLKAFWLSFLLHNEW